MGMLDLPAVDILNLICNGNNSDAASGYQYCSNLLYYYCEILGMQ